jgi:hypothetical protein
LAIRGKIVFDIKFDPKWRDKLGKIENGLQTAMVMTINDTAHIAAHSQRIQLGKSFTLRTKWTEGSIYPKRGKRLGLIPPHKKNLNSVYARTGSIQEYLADQQTGWRVRDAKVPTDSARIKQQRRRRLSKKGKLKTLRNEKTYRPSRFRKIKKNKRVGVMIEMLKKEKFKGVIKVEKRGYTLPRGFYRLKKKTLVMIRFLQKGSRKRKAERWHTEAMEKPAIYGKVQHRFNKNARYVLGKYGAK